jgi:hypothetical protein
MNEVGSEAWFRATERTLPGQEGDNASRVLRGVFAGIDYAAPRPFLKWSGKQIVEVAERALDRDWPALELATLLHEESRHRNPRVSAAVEAAFALAGYQPVHWLAEARAVLARFDIEAPARCNGAVYAVLLRPGKDGEYPVYVGSTSLTKYGGMPDRQSARIARHFRGEKASGRVRRLGLEPLWSLNRWFSRVAGRKRELTALETRVHRELEALGARVHGDTVD